MRPAGKKPDRADYQVGYGKPPAHTRFRKGRSGNPGGRPRGMTAGRATALALKELYRPVTVREGGKLIKLPAIQAVLRSKVALAAKGNGPAQRFLFEIARAIEKDLAPRTRPTTRSRRARRWRTWRRRGGSLRRDEGRAGPSD
jgi:Family of unknown function (DUF5681)